MTEPLCGLQNLKYLLSGQSVTFQHNFADSWCTLFCCLWFGRWFSPSLSITNWKPELPSRRPLQGLGARTPEGREGGDPLRERPGLLCKSCCGPSYLGQGHPGLPQAHTNSFHPGAWTDFSAGFSIVGWVAELTWAQGSRGSPRAIVLMLSSRWVTLGKLPSSCEPRLPQL